MSSTKRKIIHIDMDAFFASVEQRDNPELRGKPVAVGGAKERGVVAAASYEARGFGVYSAMPSLTARKKCPQLIFVPPRFEVYKSVSRDIRSIFKEYTDLVEPLSLDEAYLDVTENKKHIELATDIAREIKLQIKQTTGLTASAGISINKFLAKVASDYRKPDGLFVIPPQHAQAFTDQLPIEKFFGVGKVTAKKMKSLGILYGRDLKQWSLLELKSRFGKSGQYFYDVANGEDKRPVQAHRIRKSIGAEQTFSENKSTLESLGLFLNEIAQEVAHRMLKAQTMGKTITVKIKYADFTQVTRSQTLAEPVNDFESIYSVALNLLTNNHQEGINVRLLGITLSNLNTGHQSDDQLVMDF